MTVELGVTRMSIPYRFLDFVPEVKTQGVLSRTLETVQETVVRANEWVVRSGVRVVSIETVVLPVTDRDGEPFRTGQNDFLYGEGGSQRLDLMQVIRVWYTELQ